MCGAAVQQCCRYRSAHLLCAMRSGFAVSFLSVSTRLATRSTAPLGSSGVLLKAPKHKPEPVEHIDLARNRHEILLRPSPTRNPPALRQTTSSPHNGRNPFRPFHRRHNLRESGNSRSRPNHTAPNYPRVPLHKPLIAGIVINRNISRSVPIVIRRNRDTIRSVPTILS